MRYIVFVNNDIKPRPTFLHPHTEERTRLCTIQAKIEQILNEHTNVRAAILEHELKNKGFAERVAGHPMWTIVMGECQSEPDRQTFTVEIKGCEAVEVADRVMGIAVEECEEVDETVGFEKLALQSVERADGASVEHRVELGGVLGVKPAAEQIVQQGVKDSEEEEVVVYAGRGAKK
ncbi:hypothetical protein B0A55_08452 [Friedmanniomyces simplex]|uniref:Uncharacterized protein n=1 Tax=Friedmanniomyces simplex TaxID=329884 RepID=A0A4V5NGJ2_9PEZI|nr:hypothetical protein B0A55_08452 [Friedmanniomyces simplex]